MEGDRVLIKWNDSESEGILMPSPNNKITIIKLDTGYNLPIKKTSIESIETIDQLKSSKKPTLKVKFSEDLPLISILHTGGTIASRVDYKTGAVISQFTPEELVHMFPKLTSMARIRSRLMKNMWSQDMRFEHYNLIADEVDKEIKAGSSGIIITHGTDTLHYTASALSFMLQDLPIPVIIVGAQRSSDRGSTDAEQNLLNAVHFMTQSDFAGVGICMHKNESDEVCWILPGTNIRKMHTSRRDAFRPINCNAWADVSYIKSSIFWHNSNYPKRSNSKLIVHKLNPSLKVAMMYQHTHMFAEEFSTFKDYDGLVILSTGLGNLPIVESDEWTNESTKIANTLKELIDGGTVVVLAPQTIYGRLHQHVYENEVKQTEMGILAHLNMMTPETTFMKLVWLLSTYTKNQAKDLLFKNLRGEFTNRSKFNDFLL